eukprot:TRINITY_DN6913_c0_g1_i1.p1 TRINITY_DN6913_c0_g1~~TRINITY_DN6913_c0_g1_i1.p1  ORF type:complete len:209 (+),score=61.41 TRINITY_DN6913_c0_g1_i1:1045-1671(+)
MCLKKIVVRIYKEFLKKSCNFFLVMRFHSSKKNKENTNLIFRRAFYRMKLDDSTLSNTYESSLRPTFTMNTTYPLQNVNVQTSPSREKEIDPNLQKMIRKQLLNELKRHSFALSKDHICELVAIFFGDKDILISERVIFICLESLVKMKLVEEIQCLDNNRVKSFFRLFKNDDINDDSIDEEANVDSLNNDDDSVEMDDEYEVYLFNA